VARPKLYADDELLKIMAELRAWPQQSKAMSVSEATRQAISFVPDSASWSQTTRDQTRDRLIKAYRERGADLEAESRRQPRWFQGPLLPTLLTAPRSPLAAQHHETAEHLRDTAAKLIVLADALAAKQTPDPGLLELAQAVLRSIRSAAGKQLPENPQS
jgi:hypothetical protein